MVLIRREITADRGVKSVTTREVMDCIKSMPEMTFSTHDVVSAVRERYQDYSGVDFERLEYSVRQSISWLVKRGHIRTTSGTEKRFTRSHEPYWVTIYALVETSEPCDVGLLNRIFMGV